MQSTEANWEDIVQYVFTVLATIAQHEDLSSGDKRGPSWVLSILELPIFPLITKHGAQKITALGSQIFVPDSELLNEHFKRKVDILDFGDHYIWDIIPVLRYSRAGLNYVSKYGNSDNMKVDVLEPVELDFKNLRDLWERRVALTR